MDLYYDFTFTVNNTGSQAVDVTGKGPTEPFGPIPLEPGETYQYVESVNVCTLVSVTVAFTAMGDDGDCTGGKELTHTFTQVTPSPTPTATPTQLTVTAPPVTSSPTSTPSSQPTPCVPDVDYCSTHVQDSFNSTLSCDPCIEVMELIDSWCGKNWDQWCVAKYAKCCPLSACPNEEDLIGKVDAFVCDDLNEALAGGYVPPYIPPVFRAPP